MCRGVRKERVTPAYDDEYTRTAYHRQGSGGGEARGLPEREEVDFEDKAAAGEGEALAGGEAGEVYSGVGAKAGSAAADLEVEGVAGLDVEVGEGEGVLEEAEGGMSELLLAGGHVAEV